MADASITERPVGAIVQIGAWPETAGAAGSMLGLLLGAPPPMPGHSAGPAEATLLGLAPGRWLLVAEEAGWRRKVGTACAEGQAVVTDLSAARVVLSVEGAGVPGLLRRHIAFDLHPDAFPRGRCAQTQVHHMGVLLHRLAEDRFDLHVARSLARSMREWLAP